MTLIESLLPVEEDSSTCIVEKLQPIDKMLRRKEKRILFPLSKENN